MDGIWLFKHGGLEVWHIGSPYRCYMPYVESHIAEISDDEKKVDERTLPRKYARCRFCGVRFVAKVEESTGNDYELCKACRNQQGLFTDEELTRLQIDSSSHPERTRDH